MKKYIFLLIVSLAIITSCQKSKEKVFEEWAKDYTRHCPVSLDQFTRVDSMVYFPRTNTNCYYYTVMGSMDSADSIQNCKSELMKSLIHEVINSIDLKPYKDYHTTLKYIYHSDKTKKELLKITVTPEMYK